MEVRIGLVPVPGFKPGGAALAGAHGGFDSHALPPLSCCNRFRLVLGG